MLAWYRGIGDDQDREARDQLTAMLQRLIPGLKPLRTVYDRCCVTCTAHGRPYLDRRLGKDGEVGPVGCCVGGNGYAAKSSDEIGRLAARMMLWEANSTTPSSTSDEDDGWGDGIPTQVFRAVSL